MENLKEPQHGSKDHEHFLIDFIKVYKENQVLWDKEHPKYKNRDARNVALDVLLDKCKEFFPDANLDFVKLKIDGIRTAFRREYRKVLESKKVAKTQDEIYKPSLWYYHLLLFTVGEEYDENLHINENHYKNLYVWPKEQTVTLIELFKKHPILYTYEGLLNSAKGKRMKAYSQITKELTNETNRKFELEEVRKKISSLKQQFRREWRIKNSKSSNKPTTLWCYELLLFLKEHMKKKPEQTTEEKEGSDDSTDNAFIKDDEDTIMDCEKKDEAIFSEENFEDIFDTIGKNVAIKLRDMSDEQRKYAENLINEVMYHGLMENLTENTRISPDGL